LLFADQFGQAGPRRRGQPGIGWLRVITDVPVVASELLRGSLNVRSYYESLQKTRIESVFCREDPLPSLAEFALLPYLIAKKYF
jgi:predicted ATP-grasp superfamily ATP-dependent carboligase